MECISAKNIDYRTIKYRHQVGMSMVWFYTKYLPLVYFVIFSFVFHFVLWNVKCYENFPNHLNLLVI